MKPFVKRGAVALASVVMIVGVAGCGDDEGGDASTAATTAAATTSTPVGLSADEFRRQADAVCTTYKARLDAIAEPTQASEVKAYLDTTIPLQKEQLSMLQAIVPPVELKGDWDTALALRTQLIGVVEGAKARIDGGEDPEAVLTSINAQAESLDDQSDARVRAIGLTVCGADDDTTDTTSTDTTASVPTDTTASVPTDTSSTPPVSVDAFRAQADAVCKTYEARLDAVEAPSQASEVQTYLDTALPIFSELLDELRAIQPPSELQAGYAEYIDLNEQGRQVLEDARNKISNGGDPMTVIGAASTQLNSLSAQTRQKGTELGFEECR